MIELSDSELLSVVISAFVIVAIVVIPYTRRNWLACEIYWDVKGRK